MAEYIEREAVIHRIRKVATMIGFENPAVAIDSAITVIERAPTADVAPVRHGRWILEAHDERVNYRWNVTAECSECCNEKKEIWAGFFAYIVPSIARSVALTSAKRVKLSNYCPNCGAKMDLEG